MINELKAKLEKLYMMEQISEHAEADYEANPESAECEETFDRAYQNEFNVFLDCVKLVQKISDGKIDFMTAKKMIQEDRKNLLEILVKDHDESATKDLCDGYDPNSPNLEDEWGALQEDEMGL